MRFRLFCSAFLLLWAGAADAVPAPITIGSVDGLQVTLVPEGGLDARLDAAGANPPGHFLHPVRFRGRSLTELYPVDHVHHRGLFWAWRQVVRDETVIANSWLMTGMTVRSIGARRSRDGRSMTSVLRWRVGDEDVLEERLSMRLVENSLYLTVKLQALVPGLALGGSPDDKGYGGISLRLAQSDRLQFTSDGKPVQPQTGAVEAGREMRFVWDGNASPPVSAVSMSCTVDGHPITRWILRRELSMQNCVWPGKEAVALARQRALRLDLRLTVEP